MSYGRAARRGRRAVWEKGRRRKRRRKATKHQEWIVRDVTSLQLRGIATATPADPCRLPCPRKGVMMRKTQRATNHFPLLKSGSPARGRGVRCDVQMRVLQGGVSKSSTIGGGASSSPLGRPQHVVYVWLRTATFTFDTRHSTLLVLPGCQYRGSASPAPSTSQPDRFGIQGTRQVYRRDLTCVQSSRDLVPQARAIAVRLVFTASLKNHPPLAGRRPDNQKSALTFWDLSRIAAVQRVFHRMNGVAESLIPRLRAVFLPPASVSQCVSINKGFIC